MTKEKNNSKKVKITRDEKKHYCPRCEREMTEVYVIWQNNFTSKTKYCSFICTNAGCDFCGIPRIYEEKRP